MTPNTRTPNPRRNQMTHQPNRTNLPPVKSPREYEEEIARLSTLERDNAALRGALTHARKYVEYCMRFGYIEIDTMGGLASFMVLLDKLVPKDTEPE